MALVYVRRRSPTHIQIAGLGPPISVYHWRPGRSARLLRRSSSSIVLSEMQDSCVLWTTLREFGTW